MEEMLSVSGVSARVFGGSLITAIYLAFGLWGSPEAAATEFGGMANLDQPAAILDNVFAYYWKQVGDLRWIRGTSAWLEKQGMNEVSVVGFAPERSHTEGGKNLPDDLLALYWHCRTNLPVHPGVQQAWEVWNEPDFHFVEENPDRMAAVLKAAYWGIKAGNRNASVLMPSLAFNPNKYGLALARNNVYPYTDGYNFHYYGWAQDFLPSLLQHRRFIGDQHWDLPVWITEAGYFQMRVQDARVPRELARQRAFHERLAIAAYACRVDYYFPFILTPYTEEGADLSLATDAFAPRPALESYLYLSRYLPGTRPLFQIIHRRTQNEIGVVLAETSGTWFVALWSPYRLRDFSLPAESANNAIKNAPRDALATELQLEMEFPFPAEVIQTGLIPCSAGSNNDTSTSEPDPVNTPGLSLDRDRTSRVETQFSTPTDEPRVRSTGLQHIVSPIGNPQSAETSWPDRTVAGRQDAIRRAGVVRLGSRNVKGLHRSYTVSAETNLFLRIPPKQFEIKDCEWKPIAHGDSGSAAPMPRPETRPRRLPPGRGAELLNILRIPRQKPQPSPVVLQIDYDQSVFTPHKPSGAYRYTTNVPLSARLTIYNLSEQPEIGSLSIGLPEGWVLSNAEGLSQGYSRETHEIEQRTRSSTKCIRLPALSIMTLGLKFRAPERAGDRVEISYRWKGCRGIEDRCVTWLEPAIKASPPNIPWPLERWAPPPEQPKQWEALFPDAHTGRFILRELNPRGGLVSLFLRLPEGFSLADDDLLRAEIRLTSSQTNTYFRINLITETREVFRYTETLDFSQNWMEIAYRIGDFTPFFWSRAGHDYHLPTQRLRYLRISAGGLETGDAIEIRNCGVLRQSRLNPRKRARPRRWFR